MKDGIILNMPNGEEQILQEAMGSPGLLMFSAQKISLMTNLIEIKRDVATS